MRMLPLAMILPLFVSACVTATPNSGEALCDGTRSARADHAAALAVSPDDRAVVTGARLIEVIDAGCQ